MPIYDITIRVEADTPVDALRNTVNGGLVRIERVDTHSFMDEAIAYRRSLDEQVVRRTPEEIKASITPSHLISFEDGKGYRTLKRHLTGRGLTLEQYRAKWGLPADYPSVAPSYSRLRSKMAKAAGLGRRS